VSLKSSTKIALDKESKHWQSTSSSEAVIAYRYKQAVDCFGASQSAKNPEVRKAFLELEQGWLQLIPEAALEKRSSDVDRDWHKRHKPVKQRRRRRSGVSFSMIG
jgi:hypothetical protein